MADEADAGARPGSRLEPAAWLALALLSAMLGLVGGQGGGVFRRRPAARRDRCSAQGPRCSSGSLRAAGHAALAAGPRLDRGLGRAGRLVGALGALEPGPRHRGRWTASGSSLYALCLRARIRVLQPARHADEALARCRLRSPAPSPARSPSGTLITGDVPRTAARARRHARVPARLPQRRGRVLRIALFPALGLASSTAFDWRLRGLALATATLCIDLFLLAQSRASVPADARRRWSRTASVSPLRVRALSWLALAAAPRARDPARAARPSSTPPGTVPRSWSRR